MHGAEVVGIVIDKAFRSWHQSRIYTLCSIHTVATTGSPSTRTKVPTALQAHVVVFAPYGFDIKAL